MVIKKTITSVLSLSEIFSALDEKEQKKLIQAIRVDRSTNADKGVSLNFSGQFTIDRQRLFDIFCTKEQFGSEFTFITDVSVQTTSGRVSVTLSDKKD